jgi:hypothetical protein
LYHGLTGRRLTGREPLARTARNLDPEFLKLQPTGTMRVIFTPAVEEALTQGMQALFEGQNTPKAVMDTAEAASQKVGARKFKFG